jgi:hypothetical protein
MMCFLSSLNSPENAKAMLGTLSLDRLGAKSCPSGPSSSRFVLLYAVLVV